MNFKQFIRDYFTFTRNERRGVVILLIIIFLLAIANKMFFYFEKPAVIDQALFDSLTHKLAVYSDSINQISEDGTGQDSDILEPAKNTPQLRQNDKPLGEKSGKMFYFDPNKATDEEFMKLGFSKRQVDVIRKYLDKASLLKTKEDFFKIRVITEKQKQQLEPWIVFNDGNSSLTPKIEARKDIQVEIEINSADSIDLERLPGIGKVLSKRIVKYRELLGGFYSIAQLKEVYGMEDSTIDLFKSRIKVDSAKVKKIDLNFADSEELTRHPYIKKRLATKIIEFRSKFGSINKPEVLIDNMILNIDEYKKLKPYFLNKY